MSIFQKQNYEDEGQKYLQKNLYLTSIFMSFKKFFKIIAKNIT
ncbi:MAG: hypothetical protein ACI9DM_002771, partial [Cyclobacteriaceae bacterium]